MYSFGIIELTSSRIVTFLPPWVFPFAFCITHPIPIPSPIIIYVPIGALAMRLLLMLFSLMPLYPPRPHYRDLSL